VAPALYFKTLEEQVSLSEARETGPGRGAASVAAIEGQIRESAVPVHQGMSRFMDLSLHATTWLEFCGVVSNQPKSAIRAKPSMAPESFSLPNTTTASPALRSAKSSVSSWRPAGHPVPARNTTNCGPRARCGEKSTQKGDVRATPGYPAAVERITAPAVWALTAPAPMLKLSSDTTPGERGCCR
jgi:hypothetical protein